MPRGAIFGMVLHGRPLEPTSVTDPWALGRWCHPVLASIEFSEPIYGVRGHLHVWHLNDVVQTSLEQALRSATFREFAAPEVAAVQYSDPCLAITDHAEAEPILEDSHFGFRIKRAVASRDTNTPDRVEETLDNMKRTVSKQAFMESIWAKDLFRGCKNEDTLYTYVQNALEVIHGDERHHHDIAQDGSFSIGLVVPRPLSVAATEIALRHGVHCETFLLAMASNVTWQEHNWTRLGADPPLRT